MPRKKRSFRPYLILLILVGLTGAGLGLFRAGPPPTLQLAADLPAVGRSTKVTVTAEEPKRGLTRLQVDLLQGDRVHPLEDVSFTPRPSWAFWGQRVADKQLEVEVGRNVIDWLQEGTAKVRVRADRAPSWLRSPDPSEQVLELPVKLRPPQVQVRSRNTFVAQGGCEVVVYKVGNDAVRDGVQAGEWWFPGYPLPGGEEGERFALFSAPYDHTDDSSIRLVASDAVHNEARQAFIDRYTKHPISRDTIRLSEGFMARVVPAILDQTPELQDQGNLLDNYLMINRQLRGKNDEVLRGRAATSEAAFLWERPFKQMRGAKVMSTFADRRTYMYEGQEVDEQDHLGYDLASTRRAPIEASNNGVVIFAEYFGIYGNSVLIDHGYGLMSLYGHLSALSVAQGDQVERGQEIGRSGATGLAGGDHLHFTMLLQGRPVNPREWWDGHWIHDRLKLKLGDALPFES